MSEKKVSVIIPTHNRAYCLGDAVDSVLGQTYKNFELIIVDDGSTDDTDRLIGGYKDDRITYIKCDTNSGQSHARNIGLNRSSGELIAFHDSDDRWHKDKLEKIVPLFDKSDIGFAYHKLAYAFGDDKFLILPDERIPLEKKSGDIYAQLLYDNMVDMPTLTLSREAYNATGPLDESLKCLEDYDYALRLAQNFRAGFCDEILLDSTLTADGVSSRSVDYLTTSCMLIAKYKADYISTDTLNHRMEIILRDASECGLTEPVGALLEKVLLL